MNRALYLLSSFQVPTKHRYMLEAEDVAAFLNGYLALWHPALLQSAEKPPQVASPYDHEQPRAHAVYAVPENPPSLLPEDWRFRVKEANALSFPAMADRTETEAQLRALLPMEETAAPRPEFAALGFGYFLLQALADAMDHANPLAEDAFWQAVQSAARNSDAAAQQEAFLAAATKLHEAREILYSSHIYLLDLAQFGSDSAFPIGMEIGTPVNLSCTGIALHALSEQAPERLAQLRDAVREGTVEVIAGPWEEETEALWPIERQLDSLVSSLREYRTQLHQPAQTFGRRRFAATAHLPAMLHACQLRQLVLLPQDSSVLPSFKGAVLEWTGPDHRSVSALVRKPEPSHEAATFFHLAHLLHESIMQDFTACLILGSGSQPAAVWHRDFLTLHRLAPVFGQFVTVSQFLTELSANEYLSTTSADEFQSDYLVDLHEQQHPQPVSRFADSVRRERGDEVEPTLAGLARSLGVTPATDGESAKALARLVLADAKSEPGYLILNPSHQGRCVPLELPQVTTPLPSPARATQLDQENAKVVVEVPPLGFAWLPRSVQPGAKVPKPKISLVDSSTLRNEFLEADIDSQTGGLRTVRDAQRKIARLGQQLVYQPGSVMHCTDVQVISSGPALGEIRTRGELRDSQQQVLANFIQHFRLWWARPFLEVSIELQPLRPPQGYPWHAYYGCRFAWRDPHAALKRSVGWASHPTTLTRPETPDFLELHSAGHRTTMLMGGLPFHQRFGPRMLDVVLLTEFETCRKFDLAVAVDVEEPLCAAYDWLTPPVVLPVDRGPPASGPSGWFCGVDSPNLLVTSFHAASDRPGVMLRLCECRGVDTEAGVRFVQNPCRAAAVDEFGEILQELEVRDDEVLLRFAPHEMIRLLVEFGSRS